MTEGSILLLLAASLGLVLFGLSRPGGYLTYPFLCGLTYLCWIVPQLWSLLDDVMLPADYLGQLTFMGLVCLGSSAVGWELGARRRGRLESSPPIEVERLLLPVAALTAFAFSMQLMIGMQPLEARQSMQWSGPITIFAFLLNTLNVSLFLSLLIVLHRRTPATIALAAANLALALPAAFIYLRRAEMIEFALCVLGALWFAKRRTVHPLVIAAGTVALTLIVFNIEDLRRTSANEAMETGAHRGLMSADVIGSVDIAGRLPWQDANNAQEVRNAAYIVGSVNEQSAFTYGADTWNRFVFQYVPGQIVGYELKNSLMIGQSARNSVLASSGFDMRSGTTETGLGTAYREFGLFGAVFFLLTGLLLRRLWSRASAGDVWAQALYVSSLGFALISITHYSAYWFVHTPLLWAAVTAVRLAVVGGVKRRTAPR